MLAISAARATLWRVELGRPSDRRAPRRVPGSSQPSRCDTYGGRPASGRARQRRRSAARETGREEMTMGVVKIRIGEKAIIIGLVSDTHGLVRDSAVRRAGGRLADPARRGCRRTRLSSTRWSAIAPVRAVFGNVDPLDGALPQAGRNRSRRTLDPRQPRPRARQPDARQAPGALLGRRHRVRPHAPRARPARWHTPRRQSRRRRPTALRSKPSVAILQMRRRQGEAGIVTLMD